MAEFKIIKKDSKGNIEKVAIMGAKAYYVKFQEPVVIFDQKDLPRKSQTQFEYTVELLVDEDCADAYDELFPKQAATKMSKAQVMKKFKAETDEDLEAIGIDPKQKKYYFIKKVQAAQKKDGSPMSKQLRPRVVELVDGKPVDVTFDKLVGNGSSCDLLLRVSHNPTYGCFSYPAVLKCTNLIEYTSNGGGVDADTEDFLGGSVEFADEPEGVNQGSGQDASQDDDGGFSNGTEEAPDFDDDDMY